MKISKDQKTTLSEARDRAYARATAVFYKEQFPMAVARLSLKTIEQRAANALQAARKIGIVGSDVTTAYVGLAVLAGPTFLEDERILCALQSSESCPELQLVKLLKRVIENFEQLRDLHPPHYGV